MSEMLLDDRAIVVVHGVGDQVRGETAHGIAEGIPKMAPSAAVEVTRGSEALVAYDDGSKRDNYWVPTVDILETTLDAMTSVARRTRWLAVTITPGFQ